MSYQGFRNTTFIHRISPGTVVFNDLNSLKQLPGYGYAPAALVLATVVSQPTANVITCDAGHKGVSVDSGVPNCSVVGYPGLNPLKPSEEHLPIEIAPGAKAPKIGDQLYLVPKHVCPSVNNFDDALFIVNGRIRSVEPIGARGHEHSIAAAAV
jgi:D-serine deaminase-like pyridoxal phosphate-dependent protein